MVLKKHLYILFQITLKKQYGNVKEIGTFHKIFNILNVIYKKCTSKKIMHLQFIFILKSAPFKYLLPLIFKKGRPLFYDA